MPVFMIGHAVLREIVGANPSSRVHCQSGHAYSPSLFMAVMCSAAIYRPSLPQKLSLELEIRILSR
jgi:hypothetical protein